MMPRSVGGYKIDGDKPTISIDGHNMIRGNLAECLCGEAALIRNKFHKVMNEAAIPAHHAWKQLARDNNAVSSHFAWKLQPEATDHYLDDPFLSLSFELDARVGELQTQTHIALHVGLAKFSASHGALVITTKKGRTSHNIVGELPRELNAALIKAMLVRGDEVLTAFQAGKNYPLTYQLNNAAYIETVSQLPLNRVLNGPEAILADGGKGAFEYHSTCMKMARHLFDALGYPQK